jgi:hypothetical protein
MTNRALFFLTSLVIASMLILLGLNMTSILTGTPPAETYLKHNQVKGMEVGYNNLLYTLNFKQQNELIDIFNRSVKVVGLKPGKHQKPSIEKIIVYQFGLPDLVITPIAYIDNNLVFSVPEWDVNGYLMELSDGYLHQMIMQTYDH